VRTLATMLERPLIRLQCYEGLDLAGAAYEWNYGRQMMEIRLAEAGGATSREARDALAADLFSERFLTKRALLQAIDPGNLLPPVLLIDELDRADEPFEAFLLEVLSEFQITIPELGTVKALQPPIVILTSNRTREIHYAVKRRCLYHWVDFPDAARELEILHRRVPDAGPVLAQQIVVFVQQLRGIELYKQPGVAETLDWARALMALDAQVLSPEVVQHTLGVLLKYQDDIARLRDGEAQRLLARAALAAPAG
jgi:MoxR-like ATPase